MKSFLFRAFIWTASSFAVGILTWLVLAGLIWPILFYDWSITEAVSRFPFNFFYGGFFAAFVGLILAPIYFGLYIGYEILSEKHSWLKNTNLGLFITVTVFALPPAIGIAYSFEQPIIGNDQFWIDFSKTFLLTTITFAFAVLIPRLSITKLKPH